MSGCAGWWDGGAGWRQSAAHAEVDHLQEAPGRLPGHYILQYQRFLYCESASQAQDCAGLLSSFYFSPHHAF